jgi:hypothetical protein
LPFTRPGNSGYQRLRNRAVQWVDALSIEVTAGIAI